MSAFDKFYKGGKLPADAVRLAISDHQVSVKIKRDEFTDALGEAIKQIEERAALLDAMERAFVALGRAGGNCSGPTKNMSWATYEKVRASWFDLRAILVNAGRIK